MTAPTYSYFPTRDAVFPVDKALQSIKQKAEAQAKMSGILIVDNSKAFGNLAAKRIEAELERPVCTLHSFAAAQEMLNSGRRNFFVALVGLYLADAASGAIVDLMLAKGIPTIVFTGTFREEVRKEFLSRAIVDYVLKEDPHSLEYVINLMRRLKRNQNIKVLVVDDSKTIREHIGRLLRVQLYQVLLAESAAEAQALLDQYPDIQVVITDYNMPSMNGFQLTKNIRKRYSKEEMAIIGLSAQGDNNLSARFIKHGANDFIRHPFLTEEFYCRITQNIEMLELIQANKDLSNKDFLTGLYTRRYLFEVGRKLHDNFMRENLTLAVAMIDIDYFKQVNDFHGHEAGDKVLRKISAILSEWFRATDVITRFGGEEFCIITTNMHRDFSYNIFDILREKISKTPIDIGGRTIQVTVSIGLCVELLDSLELMINTADTLLYEAKKAGRNKVVINQGS